MELRPGRCRGGRQGARVLAPEEGDILIIVILVVTWQVKVILYLEPVPEVLPPVRPLHEHRLRVELGVVLGLPEQHRVEIPANSQHYL